MSQEKLAEKIFCPQCGGENDRRDENCFNCQASLLITKTKKNHLQLVEQQPSSNKKKRKFNRLSVAISLGVLVVVGLGLGSRSITLFNQRAESENSSEARPQLQGLMRVWTPPGIKDYLTKLVAKELSNKGRFNIVPIDIGNRDPIEELKQGTVSFILIDKVVLAKQLEAARELGYDVVTMPIAMDAVVYGVNAKKTGVKSLTRNQIDKIYRGEITNWQQVGGKDLKIHVILLSERNSLNINFRNQLSSNTKFVGSHSLAMKALKKHDGGLAYTSPSLATKQKGIETISLKNESGEIISPLIEIEGQNQPNLVAFGNGDYPDLKTIMLAYLNNGLTHERVMAEGVRDYLISKEGQELLRKSGQVPLYVPIQQNNQ